MLYGPSPRPLLFSTPWQRVFSPQPHLAVQLEANPWGLVFPLTALAGLAGMRVLRGRRAGLDSFLASCVFIIGMQLGSPRLRTADRSGLVYSGKIPGMLLTAGYFTYTYRSFSGKVRV
jgi:hypothetical protein